MCMKDDCGSGVESSCCTILKNDTVVFDIPVNALVGITPKKRVYTDTTN